MNGVTSNRTKILKLRSSAGESRALDRLAQLQQPVSKLYYKGHDEVLILLNKPTVAIVGSRHPTSYGLSVTEELVEGLVAAGVVIISGLALGIDSVAHSATLASGGQTIAVLPTGLDTVYPARHKQLAADIIATGGLLVSEYPDSNSHPMKYQFIARNRIIAALADVIVVTEAAERSGSLHTVDFGLELGSDILAVPGSIYSPMSAGTNRLIQKGAQPVLSAKDILDCLT